MYRRGRDNSVPVDSGLDLPASHSLHATWMDGRGGVWAVGGHVLTPGLDAGVVLYRGQPRASQRVERPPVPPVACPDAAIDPVPAGSIARRWNAQMLGAIARDIPRPTVHACNLFHVSMAMWDAWNVLEEAARHEAIFYAAYRVLPHRYADGVGGARIIDTYADDGANEATDYAAPENWVSENRNLVVDLPGTPAEFPTLWQKLVLAKAVTQKGIPEAAGSTFSRAGAVVLSRLTGSEYFPGDLLRRR